MKVFVTGASGFIGQAVIKDLLSHGHQVLGLARSDSSAKTVASLGAEVIQGDLEDLSALKQGAEKTDGTIHLAFVHDFDNFARGCEIDRTVIQTIADAISGTKKPLIIASGVGGVTLGPDGVSAEDSPPVSGSPFSIRHASTALLEKLAKENGFRGVSIRLSPTVHDEGDTQFVPQIISAARKNQKVVYVGDGSNCWPAVHRKDAAVLFRLALEKGESGKTYNAVAESGVKIIDIMDVIKEQLKLPTESMSTEEAVPYLGFFAHVVSMHMVTSSEKTQTELGWKPESIGLLEDMKRHYF